MAEPTYYDLPLTGAEIDTALSKAETAWQDTDVPDLAALDHGGNARGTNAVNLQTGRGSADRVASGAESTAIGYSTKASGGNATAVGNNNNTASGSYSVALGWGSLASGHGSAALASGAEATSGFALAIGDGSDATQDSAVAIGRSAQATGGATVAIGKEAAASGTNSIALGANAVAHGFRSAVLGGLAYGTYAVALGPMTKPTAMHETVVRGLISIPRDDWSDQYEAIMAGAQAAFCTPPVDLGVPPAWAGATEYDNGDIVQPTTGGTVQYRAWTDWPIETGIHATATSTATEPTWPGAGDSVDLDADGDHSWVGIDWSTGYETMEIPDGLAFFPTEIAFVCHEHSTLTGTPNVSVGTAAAPGLLVDADDVTITAAPQIFRFTLANPNAGIPSNTAIQIKINTAASAGRCVGRFLLSGFFVENPTNAV